MYRYTKEAPRNLIYAVQLSGGFFLLQNIKYATSGNWVIEQYENFLKHSKINGR